jgi:hypothetical protein
MAAGNDLKLRSVVQGQSQIAHSAAFAVRSAHQTPAVGGPGEDREQCGLGSPSYEPEIDSRNVRFSADEPAVGGMTGRSQRVMAGV